MDNKIKLTNIVKECGFSRSIVTRLNNDLNIEIKIVLDKNIDPPIPITQAVETITK
jgi:tRNA(Phe) wybutosine-synthesizing methylase Tyw3